MIHLIYNENHDMWYTLLLKFKKIFLKGGIDRMKHTLPALIFCLFRLSMAIETGTSGATSENNEEFQVIKVDQAKVFKAVNELILALQEHKPEACLKLYL